jgi:hypothetical protein
MKKHWKLYLYYNGILIKKVRINEDEEPSKQSYPVRVFFKQQLFKNIVASVVVRPIKLLKTDEKKKKTYWGTTMETGIDI